MSQRAFHTIPLSISEQYTEENIKSHKEKIWKRVRAYPLDHPTTDSYQDSEILDARLLKNKVIYIKNTHNTNGLLYKVLACIDPQVWTEIKTETTLAATNDATITSSDPWAYYKIQVKSATSGNAANVRAFMSGQS